MLSLFVLNSSVVFPDILISKLDDVSLSTNANVGRDLIITEQLCIASNPVSVYGITALGSGDNGEFVITNGPYEMEYKMSYRDRRSRGGFTDLTPGVPVSGFLARPLRNNRACQGNAGRLRIIIEKNSLNRAVAGLYRGVIQLSVVPE
tara:strand:- start:197031 stop:197474 length:444 start_codon:yes stop_codon:yes gene_type:complete